MIGMSYLTPDDLALIQRLPKDAPYAITGVTGSQFSVARTSMGCTAYGHQYHYNPITDELIRADVLRLVEANRRTAQKAARTAQRKAARDAQGSLL